ncbi:MAG: hypothetical protein ACR2NA_12910 [Solirubrobacterales bacterium]
MLWRAGLRIGEALDLHEGDLEPARGALLVREGKGGRRRPVGPLFCVIDGPTCGRPWSAAAVRIQLRRLAAEAGVRRRFAPHQLRHAHAVEMAREGGR